VVVGVIAGSSQLGLAIEGDPVTMWRKRTGWTIAVAVIAVVMAFVAVSVTPTEDVASAGTARTPVWVGAAVDGTWPTADGCAGSRYPSADCSQPSTHHTFKWGNPYPGDFGFDQQNVAPDATVRVYAAPQDPNIAGRINARIESVGLACRAEPGETYAQTRGRGGDAVRVGIYDGGTRVGTVTYVHVNAAVSGGQAISRWGGVVGTVGSYRSNPCWRGRHLHAELYNDVNYACYNRGWRSGQRMSVTNFIGYLGGAFASAPRQACP
jgi:hypothetical protein